jgi:hypothetical protein
MTEFPASMAGRTTLTWQNRGQFQGLIQKITPRGTFLIYRLCVRVSVSCDYIRFDRMHPLCTTYGVDYICQRFPSQINHSSSSFQRSIHFHHPLRSWSSHLYRQILTDLWAQILEGLDESFSDCDPILQRCLFPLPLSIDCVLENSLQLLVGGQGPLNNDGLVGRAEAHQLLQLSGRWYSRDRGLFRDVRHDDGQ